ncbi:hypothetical protein HDV06_000697 [Boothiomyces sp. JEL0866]|nr:hypothetical protein HDV06_000697 [Boothiomyces sp. JEL0866]
MTSFQNAGFATIKSIISGDSVILRGKATNGPPPELILSLSNINAPRLGNKSVEEEAFAYESREYLRNLLVGKQVKYKLEYASPNRQFGGLEVQHPIDGETDIARILAKNGMVRVKQADGKRIPSEEQEYLLGLEEHAKAKRLGLWSDEPYTQRQIAYNFESDPRQLLEKYRNVPVDAIVEQVRDGSTLRVVAILDSVHQYLTVQISGIKAPVYRKDIPGVPDLIEPLAEEAKYFTEVRLLQRSVKILLESVSGQGQGLAFYGTILHPAGNIAELLLSEGYAKILDWNLASVTNPEKYKDCESAAKAKQLRLWKGFVKTATNASNFQATVTKIIGPDLILVEVNGKERKIGFSSIRGPKRQKNEQDFDIGYYLDAIEYLRARLVGQKVTVKIDYVKPAEGEYEKRDCATVLKGEVNIAEMLVTRGYASVIKHKKDDHNRSSAYDKLLEAEEKAIASTKGIHSTKDLPVHRIIDASENATKAKNYLAQLQRGGKLKCVVEYVASGSRFRILVPPQNLRLTLVLSGIRTPKAGKGENQKSEPYGNEAAAFANSKLFQRDVEASIEGVDKVGGFIGTLFVPVHHGPSSNYAQLILEQGLATVHEYSASQSPHANQLIDAESAAKTARKNLWTDYDPASEVAEEVSTLQVAEAKITEVLVTEVSSNGNFFVQISGPELKKLEKLMADFSQYHSGAGQQLIAPFTPKVGEYCSAQFTADKQWYRARVRKINGANSYNIWYIDYGNSETVPGSRLRPLPTQFSVTSLKPQAVEAQLAYIDFPTDESDYLQDAVSEFCSIISGQTLYAKLIGVNNTTNGVVQSVLLYVKKPAGAKIISVNQQLIESSLAYVSKVHSKRYLREQREKLKNKAALLSKAPPTDLEMLMDAQEVAKKSRANIWRYGDFTEDDD